MSEKVVRLRILEWIVCILLVLPFLLLGAGYVEHRVAGTHRIKEALHVDQLLHALDAIILHR